MKMRRLRMREPRLLRAISRRISRCMRSDGSEVTGVSIVCAANVKSDYG